MPLPYFHFAGLVWSGDSSALRGKSCGLPFPTLVKALVTFARTPRPTAASTRSAISLSDIVELCDCNAFLSCLSAIEEKRAKKEIGSSLEAQIEVFVSGAEYDLMENLDLAEYFITSKAIKIKNKNKDEKTRVIVKKSEGKKCPRCWKILQGKCDRCDEVMQNTNA